MFILFLLNYRVWFTDPFSLTSDCIMDTSDIINLSCCHRVIFLLKREGKPDSNFENTSVLVNQVFMAISGIRYTFQYSFLEQESCLKDPETLQLILGTINLVAVYITARIEEKEMIAKFGDEYREYMKETKMFIPFIFVMNLAICIDLSLNNIPLCLFSIKNFRQ